MAFDRWHAAFYANSFTLASFCVCLWEDVSKNGGLFDGFNYSWGGSILQVVLAGDFDFSSQNHTKCPAQLQVLFAVLLLVFSLCLAASSPFASVCGEIFQLASFLPGDGGGIRGSLGVMLSAFSPVPPGLIPDRVVDNMCFRTNLEGHKQPVPCFLFPPKSFLHHGSCRAVPVCTHPYLSPLSLSVGHGKCGQPSGRTRLFTPFQKQPSSLPSSTQRILKQTLPCNPKFAEASVSSLEFWKKKKKLINVKSLPGNCVCWRMNSLCISHSSYLYLCRGPCCPHLLLCLPSQLLEPSLLFPDSSRCLIRCSDGLQSTRLQQDLGLTEGSALLKTALGRRAGSSLCHVNI